MTRRSAAIRIIALFFALLAPVAARAQDSAALDPKKMEAACDTAEAFMKALRKQDVGAALQFVGTPFVAEDARLLATADNLRTYLTNMLAKIEPKELPNAVLAVLDYEQSRAATESSVLALRDAVLAKGDLLIAAGRDGLSRGVLLVKMSGEKPLVVGVGY